MTSEGILLRQHLQDPASQSESPADASARRDPHRSIVATTGLRANTNPTLARWSEVRRHSAAPGCGDPGVMGFVVIYGVRATVSAVL